MTDLTRTYGSVDAKGNPSEVTAANGQDRRHPRLKRLNGHSNSGSSSSAGGRDLNYCEVYFVSPSKRRSKEDLQTVPSSPQNTANWAQKRRDQFKPQVPENAFAFNTFYQNRIYDPNYDSFETRSHFSDSAATLPNQMNRGRNNNVTFSNCTEERIHSNRGSLKRNKGRSNQSLCSCDAETEIVPNPNRPLYQYSLDRKNKSHTYTCEQNAQILMRLERERGKPLGASSSEKQINVGKELVNGVGSGACDDSSFEYPVAYQDTSNSLESDSMTDVDIIPPPPPPISSSRKAVTYQQDLMKGYAKPTESMLNDCTSTILNCANVGHIGNSKPDLCNINRTDTNKSRANQENIPLTPYPYIRDDTYVPCFKSKVEDSVFFYHQESPQYAPNFDNRPQSGKFNTIGPSSYCSKQFSSQQLPNGPNNAFASNNLSNGRYFSQSLSNFSFGGQNNLNDGYQWHQHNHNDFSSTPYTQFRTPINGLSCSFGDSALANSSYTTLGSSSSGLKEKFNLQQQQQQQPQQTSSSNMPWKHRQCPSRGSSSSGTSSLRFDPSRHWLAVSSILLIVGAASVAVPLALRVAASAPFEERLRAATQLLDEVPLIDGHNDLPWNIRKFLHNKLNDFHFDEDLRNVMPWARSHWSHTDLKRLKQGRVAAQFWAAYVPCEAQHRDAVQLTLEQIDVIKRLTERYSKELTTCTSASDIIEAHKSHKVCSLTGVEGGHSLGGSLAVLRTLYAIGVRYLTLTSTCHTPWADSSHADAPKYDVKHGGLTVFGKTIIREMNRLGMIVDLSHVSTGTMRDALATSEAPVIFSHSSAYELCNSSRNVQDDILLAIAKNGGLVMVNFYSKFLSCTDNSTVHDAVAHINHIKRIAGIDHVGLGAGFDGINFTPKGLEDVSSYPTLFAELLGEGWSVEDLTKLAGQNFLRVMSEVEKIRDNKKLAGVRPYEDHPNFRSEDPYNCTSS